MQILLAILSVLTLSQCGKQNVNSSKVDITVSPQVPIVITGDVGGLHPRKQPWFDFNVELTNNSEYTFKLVAMKAEVTLLDGTATSVMEVTWAPSSNDVAFDTYSCAYADYGTWSPGQSKSMYITNSTGAASCYNGAVGFVADNLPIPSSPNNFRYRVKLKPLGYFINSDGEADDRFERYKSFFTK